VKIKFIHALWTHLPAVAALIILIVYIIVSGPLPSTVPIHFNSAGEPNGYGPPWALNGLIIVLSVFFIALSIFFDELWARQEKAKTFNWLSLFDDITVGWMVGITLGYLEYIYTNATIFVFPWKYIGLVGGVSVILAILLEMIRPYRSHPEKIGEGDTPAFKTEITRRLQGSTPFVYWDYQNPFYVSLLTMILPMIFIMIGILSWSLSWFDQPWQSVMFFIMAVLFVVPYGGQRVLVTRHDITVRWGMVGFRVLQIAVKDVTMVEKHEFSPLRDFGGYGIRMNRDTTAYFLSGNWGVRLTTVKGRKYLIGSNNTDRLVEVIKAVSSAR
jgi:hypothetical protein